jgi:hypothetical protein
MEMCECEGIYKETSTEKGKVRIANSRHYNEMSSSFSGMEDPMKKKNLEGSKEKQTSIAVLICEQISIWLNRHTPNSELYLLTAAICDELLNQKSKALFEVMKAEECTPSIKTQFQMFARKLKISNEAHQEEAKKENTTRNTITKYVKYYEQLISVQDIILKAIEYYEVFWNEIKQANPCFDKLISIVESIALSNENIKNCISLIQVLGNNDIKAIIYYSLYMKIVEEDYFAANEQHIKYKSQSNMGRNTYDNIEYNYGPISSVGVVMISGNKAEIGKVLNCNHEIVETLGYSRNELIDNNINIAMPFLIRTHHNNIIEHFYNKNSNEAKLSTKESMVMAQHKNGYIVPCVLIFKMFQYFSKGISFVGFIRKSKVMGELRLGEENYTLDDSLILVLNKNNQLIGFNKDFAQLVSYNLDSSNLTKYLNQDKLIDISDLHPKLYQSAQDVKSFGAIGTTEILDLNPLKEAIEQIIDDGYMRLQGGGNDADKYKSK